MDDEQERDFDVDVRPRLRGSCAASVITSLFVISSVPVETRESNEGHLFIAENKARLCKTEALDS